MTHTEIERTKQLQRDRNDAKPARSRYQPPTMEVSKMRLVTLGGTIGQGDSGQLNTALPTAGAQSRPPEDGRDPRNSH